MVNNATIEERFNQVEPRLRNAVATVLLDAHKGRFISYARVKSFVSKKTYDCIVEYLTGKDRKKFCTPDDYEWSKAPFKLVGGPLKRKLVPVDYVQAPAICRPKRIPDKSMAIALGVDCYIHYLKSLAREAHVAHAALMRQRKADKAAAAQAAPVVELRREPIQDPITIRATHTIEDMSLDQIMKYIKKTYGGEISWKI